KTTLPNALCRHLPPGERVVTIEDAAELRLPGDHVVRLETRPATPDGLPAVGVRGLPPAALRMRPDRSAVVAARGAAAFDIPPARTAAHGGCTSTCHANGPADALRRVETMALLGGVDVPLLVARRQMLRAVDLVVHVARGAGASRRVTAVAEVVEHDDDRLEVRPLADAHGVVGRRRRPARAGGA